MSSRFPVAKSLSVDELLEAYDQILPRVDEALAEANITPAPEKPSLPDELEGIVLLGMNGDPFPPEDMTAMELVTLGLLYSYINTWTNYVQAETTRAQSMLGLERDRLKTLKSALRIWYRTEKGVPASDVDDYINTDSRYVMVEAEVRKLEAYFRACESRFEQLKRTCTSASREQTRRASEFERQMHEGGKPKAPARFT